MPERIPPELKAVFAHKKPERIVPRDQKRIIPLFVQALPARNGEEVEVVLAIFGPRGEAQADQRLSAQTALWMARKIIEELGEPPPD